MLATRRAGMVDRLKHRVSRRQANITACMLTRWTSPWSRILDIGCGSGALAHILESELGYSSVYNVDVIDLHRYPLRRYLVCNTAALPFDDGSFDLTALNFVLHHIPDEQKIPVLREAARVTRGYIFILEDTPEHLVDHACNWLHGWTWRLRHGHDADFGFHARATWKTIFAALGLEVAMVERLSRLAWPGVPSGRSCFLLGPVRPSAAAGRVSMFTTREQGWQGHQPSHSSSVDPT